MCVVYDIWLHQIFIFTDIVIVRDHCNVGLPLSAFFELSYKVYLQFASHPIATASQYSADVIATNIPCHTATAFKLRSLL
jgi:hypothetical protein